MFQLLISPTSGLPSIVSTFSEHYPDLLQLGYTIKAQGTKRKLEDMMSELYGDLINEVEN